jgi:hypothetical protein
VPRPTDRNSCKWGRGTSRARSARGGPLIETRVRGAWLLLLCACGSAAPPPIVDRPLPIPDGKAPLLGGAPLTPRLASYRIDATLDVAAKEVRARETLVWKHDGTEPVRSVPLHLYMNAFKNETSTFLRESHGHHRGATKAGGSWGWIEVPSIHQGGVELRPKASYGEDETTLTVPLAQPIAPGETLTLELTFTTRLPEVFARTGYDGEFFLVGQWFPKIGVLRVERGQQRWHCDTFHVNSEFFADFGTYDVDLHVPRTHMIAATGVLTGARDDAAGRVLTYRAEDVHDFVFMADPWMQVAKTTATVAGGSVEVRVYHRPDQAAFAARHLESAKRTIETFSRLFVAYPWPIMSIIDPPPDAAGSAGGMEYPTLVTTAGDVDLPGQHLLEEVTIHEVGHNWFQGILATNEVDEAWLDEGLNTYVDGIVADAMFGPDRSTMDNWIRVGYYGRDQLLSDADGVLAAIDTKSYLFPDFGDYGAATYYKTSVIMKTLEGMLGRDRVWGALGHYAKKWAYKHPGGDDFIAAISEGLGEDARWFLEPALRGRGDIDLQVGRIETRRANPPQGVFGEGDKRETRTPEDPKAPWESSVVVANAGRVPAIVDVAFRFEGGEVITETWSDRTTWKRFTFRKPTRLVEVTMDPAHKIFLESNALDDALRAPGSSRAAATAGARVGFWAQVASALVGL